MTGRESTGNKIHNRTIFTGDNLHVMRGIRSESVDLIYLDPPFNSKHDYAAPIGSKAAGAEFKDTWTLSDIDLEWWGEISESHPGLYKLLEAVREVGGKSMMSYIIYMSIRLIEMARVLKPTGFIYLHCDPTASHYLKLCMDEVFGSSNFRNEIIWERNSGRTKIKHQDGRTSSWGTQHDVLFLYSKSSQTPNLKLLYVPDDKKFPLKEPDGREFSLAPIELAAGMGRRPNQEFTYKGYRPKHGWRFIKKSLIELDRQKLIHWNDKGKPYKKLYKADHKGKPISNIWSDIDAVRGKEKQGYPTQKPLALMERIILASSREEDVVLDPFCGCATTCLAAEKLGRKWIGIDVSELAAKLIKARMLDAARAKDGKQETIDRFTTGAGQIIHRTDLPKQHAQRTPCLKNLLYGKQEGICNGCCQHFQIRLMDIDHIVATALGGQDIDDNKQLLCSSCNRIKGKKSMAALKARLRELGIISGDAC